MESLDPAACLLLCCAQEGRAANFGGYIIERQSMCPSKFGQNLAVQLPPWRTRSLLLGARADCSLVLLLKEDAATLSNYFIGQENVAFLLTEPTRLQRCTVRCRGYTPFVLCCVSHATVRLKHHKLLSPANFNNRLCICCCFLHHLIECSAPGVQCNMFLQLLSLNPHMHIPVKLSSMLLWCVSLCRGPHVQRGPSEWPC